MANAATSQPSASLARRPTISTQQHKPSWNEVAACAPPRLLAAADRFVVASFAVAVGAFREAIALRDKTSVLVRSLHDNRSIIVNPLNGEIRRQSRLIVELGAQIGLTPSSRMRILDGLALEGEPMDPAFVEEFGPLRLIRGDRA
jgi:phage terminase small subunit